MECKLCGPSDSNFFPNSSRVRAVLQQHMILTPRPQYYRSWDLPRRIIPRPRPQLREEVHRGQCSGNLLRRTARSKTDGQTERKK